MQKITLSLLLFLASAAMVYYYVLSALDAVKILKKENAALEAVVEEMRGLVEKKNELEDLYNSISENDRRKIDELAPVNPRLAEFLIKIDLLTSRNGIHFSSVNFGDPAGAPENPYLTSALSLGLTGTYEALKNFLKDTERFVRIIDVDNIGFSSPLQFGDPLSISFTAKTYQSR